MCLYWRRNGFHRIVNTIISILVLKKKKNYVLCCLNVVVEQ